MKAPRYSFLGCLTHIKADGSQTGGAFGLIEQKIPSGFASPWHVHRNEDEAFYVLEGEVTFISEGAKIVAGPGAYVYLPGGAARFLVLVTPSGFEQFVADMSEPGTDSTSPPAGPPDMGKLMSLASKYGLEILGPLPE